MKNLGTSFAACGDCGRELMIATALSVIIEGDSGDDAVALCERCDTIHDDYCWDCRCVYINSNIVCEHVCEHKEELDNPSIPIVILDYAGDPDKEDFIF